MGASAAARFGVIEVHCVGVGSYDHVAGSKSNAVAWVGGYLFKDLHNGNIGCLCVSRLLLP